MFMPTIQVMAIMLRGSVGKPFLTECVLPSIHQTALSMMQIGDNVSASPLRGQYEAGHSSRHAALVHRGDGIDDVTGRQN